MTKGASESLGFLGELVVKSAAGTDVLFPEISDVMGYWINFDSSSTILNLQKAKNDGPVDIRLRKQN